MITEPLIRKFTDEKLAAVLTELFNEHACEYNVNTPLRVSAFMSQLLDHPNPQAVIKSLFELWYLRSMNRYADIQHLEEICKRATGDLYHFAEKVVIYNKFCNEFGLPEYKVN